MTVVAENIEIVMSLDDQEFKIDIKNAGQVVEAFVDQINRSIRPMERMERQMGSTARASKGFTSSLRDWTVIIGQSRNALNQIGFVTTQWMSAIVRTNAEIERMTFLLKGMSEEVGTIAREKYAADTLEDLFDQAKNSPFAIGVLTDAFVKFKSVGLDPTDGSMQSLVDATAAFGGTGETFKRATIAIQQMAGKGVISMEELRQQLGEAVPSSINIMARELGTTYGKLVAEISKGTVAAKPALEALFDGFAVDFSGRAKQLMQGFNGQLARLKTNLTEIFTQNDGMKKYFEGVTDALEGMNDAIETGRFDDFLTVVGDGLSVLVNKAWEATESMFSLLENVRALYAIWQNPLPENGPISQMILQVKSLTHWLDMAIGKLNAITGFNFDAVTNWVKSGFTEWEGFIVEGGLLDKAMGDIDDQIGSRLSSLLQESGNEMLRQKMIDGLYVAPDALAEATSAFTAQNDKIIQLQGNLERLRTAQEQVGNFDPSIMSGSMSGQDADTLRQMDAYLQNGQRSAAELQTEIDAVSAALAIADEESRKMAASLGDIEDNAADIEMKSLIDEGAIQSELDAFVRDRNAALDEVIANSGLAEEEAVAQRVAINEEYLANVTAAYEQQREAALAGIEQTGMLGFLVAEQVNGYFDAAIADAQNRIAGLITNVKEAGGKIPSVASSDKPKKKKGGGGASKGERAADRLAEMMRDAKREAEETSAILADPFAFKIPDAIEKTRDKLEKLAKDMGGMTPMMEELMRIVEATEVNKLMIDVRDRQLEAEEAVMGESRARQKGFNDEITRLQRMKASLQEAGLWRVEHEKQLQATIAAIQEQAFIESPLGEFANQWKTYFDDMQSFAVDAMKSVAGEVSRVLVTPKEELEDLSEQLQDFARSMLQTFLQLQLEAAMSGVFDAMNNQGGWMQKIGSAIAGAWGGGGTATVPVSHAGSVGGGNRQRKIDIGPTYSKQVSGQERLAVVQKSEGVFTREQMGALGGLARQSPNVAVNMINNGQQAEVEQTNAHFDGEKMILDVVMRNVQRPGALRDTLKDMNR